MPFPFGKKGLEEEKIVTGGGEEDTSASPPTKEELFKDDPERFIDLSECLLVITKNEGGVYGVMNNCRSVIDLALMFAHAVESTVRRWIQVRTSQSQQKPIKIYDSVPQGFNPKTKGAFGGK